MPYADFGLFALPGPGWFCSVWPLLTLQCKICCCHLAVGSSSSVLSVGMHFRISWETTSGLTLLKDCFETLLFIVMRRKFELLWLKKKEKQAGYSSQLVLKANTKNEKL